MHLVRHREVVETLAQVPPAMPGEFAPDTAAARKIVSAAIDDGRQWLDPVEIKQPARGLRDSDGPDLCGR